VSSIAALAIVLQVRLGLRPLERLRQAVADVRTGRSERVPAEQLPRLGESIADRLRLAKVVIASRNGPFTARR
jgi:hypothetical protein